MYFYSVMSNSRHTMNEVTHRGVCAFADKEIEKDVSERGELPRRETERLRRCVRVPPGEIEVHTLYRAPGPLEERHQLVQGEVFQVCQRCHASYGSRCRQLERSVAVRELQFLQLRQEPLRPPFRQAFVDRVGGNDATLQKLCFKVLREGF